MANLKPNKENIITEILIELEKGISFTACAELFDMNWSLPSTTFKRYWKEANERYQTVNVTAQKELSDIFLEGKKEALKKAILTKHERMELLSKIATGEIPTWREVITEAGIQKLEYYSGAEAKAAIAEINKMDGEYAPIKKDITSNGQTISINFED